jgi:hypothetical protein
MQTNSCNTKFILISASTTQRQAQIVYSFLLNKFNTGSTLLTVKEKEKMRKIPFSTDLQDQQHGSASWVEKSKGNLFHSRG